MDLKFIERETFNFETRRLIVQGRPEAIKRCRSIYAATRLFHSDWSEQSQIDYMLFLLRSMTVSYQLRNKK